MPKGGGIGSKATGRPTQYFVGQPSTRINPRGVSQIGQSLGNHSMDSGGKPLTRSVEPVRAGAMGGMGSVPLGSAVAQSTVCGPGGSRTVMRNST
jgi:hypothetical protein